MPGCTTRWLIALCGLSLASGCVVPQKKYMVAMSRNENLQLQLNDAKRSLASVDEERRQISEQFAALHEQLATHQELEGILEQRIVRLQQEMDGLGAEMAGVVMTAAGVAGAEPGIVKVSAAALQDFSLAPVLVDRLASLARQQEGMRFIADEKVLRMSSDRLFATGDRMRPDWQTALAKLANILNSPEAAQLNLLVVGHTAGRSEVVGDQAAFHPTDWHLAAHQAIAVEQFLEERGVQAERLGVASYGSYQPLLENKRDRRNARLEIYFLPPDPPAGP